MPQQIIDIGTIPLNGRDGDNARTAFTKVNANFTELDTLKADKTVSVIAGTGLSGGGNLSESRTLSVTYGTTTGTAAQGNDTRLSNAREWTATTVTQAEAEAGGDTTRKAWTVQRVWQAINAWWNTSAAKTKLDGIATGATANSTDAQLRDRATHTGVQPIGTITGLQTALDAKQGLAANLTAFSNLAGSANKGVHFTGSGALSLHDQTAFARTLLDDVDATAARNTLGLGSAATRTALGSTGGLYSRDSVLGTVSQSAGVPTGALMEYGSNANGEYWRYAGGMQVCTKVVATGPNTTAEGVIWKSAAASGGSWAAAFIAAPTPGICGTDNRGGGWAAMDLYPTYTTAGSYSTRGATSGGSAGLVYVTAVGRWF